MEITTTNPLFTQAKEMNAICEPLFTGSDIGFFVYTRHYRDDTMMKLSTYPEVSQAVLKSKCTSDRERITCTMQANKVNCFHDTFYLLLQEHNPEANTIGKHYNIDSTIIIIDQQSDYLEGFAFASGNMENLLRFYFNNWALLLQFKHYFLDKATHVIKNAEKALFTPDYRSNYNRLGNVSMQSTDIEELKKTLTPQHYFILHQGKRVSITKHEFDCLKGMAQGRSNKEIGRLLAISPRTVEATKPA